MEVSATSQAASIPQCPDPSFVLPEVLGYPYSLIGNTSEVTRSGRKPIIRIVKASLTFRRGGAGSRRDRDADCRRVGAEDTAADQRGCRA